MNKFYPLIFVLSIFFISEMLVGHVRGSKILEPTWKSFSEVATNNRYSKETEYMNAGFDARQILDFKGKLDSILLRRNEILRKEGFIAIGKWVVIEETGGVICPMEQCFYVYVGKWW